MHVTQGRGRRAASFGVGLLLVFSLLSWGGAQVNAQSDATPNLRGYATGQPAHVSVIESLPDRLVNGEVAWSAAAVDADKDGLNPPERNEVNRIYEPESTTDPETVVAGKLTYARGSGLELGVGTTPDDANQLVREGLAEEVAPPDNKQPHTTKEIALEGAAPLAYASALRGQAAANSANSDSVPDYCVVGDDLSRGIGYAADVQLLDAANTEDDAELEAPVVALDDQNPDRAVSNSISRTKLIPTGKTNNYGLMAEVRQTIAPVTILQNEVADGVEEVRLITIEVLGEWVLRVFALGNGTAGVHYGPGEVNPQTPLLRIHDSANDTPLDIYTQQLFEDGFELPEELGQLIELSIGEKPRKIAEPGAVPDNDEPPVIGAGGRSAAAAVDVVRLRLLSQPDPQVGDIRIGHMEASVEVPAGGVDCPIPVKKKGNRDTIRIGEEPDDVTFSITVENPYDCDMIDVVLTDRITQEEGDPNFRVIDASPTPTSPSIPTEVGTSANIEWDLDTIKPGGSKTVEVTIQSANAGGVLRDIAEATAVFDNCSGEDASGFAIQDLALAGLSVPVDVAIETPLTGTTTTRTAATGGILALAAVALGLFLRRRGAHQT